MVFSSHLFLFLFLPASLILYYLSPRWMKSATLTAVSLVFYGWWRPDFILLMLLTAGIDYGTGIQITRARERGGRGKAWLLVSMISNLGLLGYFKYANFGIASFNTLLGAAGGEPIAWTEVILPVGISFYTFQTMSYTIDIYWDRVKKADSFIDYLCYVTMFPQLVAGPIVRYITVEEQLRKRTHTSEKFFQGIVAMQTGLVKKLLLADTISQVADSAFAASDLTPLAAWVGIIAYAFQIYFDFSGYSDMAIGLGLMFGFRFPINFDRPYCSISVTDFWRRWHISLSTWLRDYLYVPLGGNRKGALRTYINLLLTMLLGGLWHGANWTFIAWGAYQGVWMVIERLAGKKAVWAGTPMPLQIAITFVVTCCGWVFFRAANLDAAFDYLGTMFSFGEWSRGLSGLDVRPLQIMILLLSGVVLWGLPSTQTFLRRIAPAYSLAIQPLFILAILHLFYQQNVPFLYFQF